MIKLNKYALRGEPIYGYSAPSAYEPEGGRLIMPLCGYYQTMPSYHIKCDDNDIFGEVSIGDIEMFLRLADSLHSFRIFAEHVDITCSCLGFVVAKNYSLLYDQTPEFIISYPHPPCGWDYKKQEWTHTGLAYIFDRYDLYNQYVSLIFTEDYRRLGGVFLHTYPR